MRIARLLHISLFTLLMASIQIVGIVQGQGVPGTELSIVPVAAVNPLSDVILPRLYPVIALDVSPSLGDATLINRIRFVVALAMVDAAAPYHPSAVGIYTRLPRQPEEERTNRNINTAMMHGAYHALVALLPEREPVWGEMMRDYGLDPDDLSTDPATPVGIGNLTGQGAVEARLYDGMNQMGNYLDTTGYFPVNSAFELRDPSRWQPGLRLMGTGLYTVQQFVTPQLANVEPFAPFDPRELRVAAPNESSPEDWEAYKRQVDAVLETSANLTDELKMKSELFDNKVASLGLSYLHIADTLQFTPADTVRGYFLKAAAWMDAAIVTWQEKIRYDAVRPFSAIPYVYGDELVTGWGGPGEGSSELPASRWMAYLPENDHPEYPSGSTCGCYAHAQALRRFTNTDGLDWRVSYPAGSSRIEPGVTPARDMDLHFPTWTDFASDCGNSRHWGGVHFPAAVEVSAAYCSSFGDMAFDYFQTVMDGTAPLREAAQELDVDPWLAATARPSATTVVVPDVDNPTPLACENVAESVTVTAVNSGVICQSVSTVGLGLLAGFLDAVSVTGELDLGVQICFEESGSLILFDNTGAEPLLTELTSYQITDATCAWINSPGTVLLVGSSSPFERAEGLSDTVEVRLPNCQVITEGRLNFREAPAGTRLSITIPRNSRLTATARTADWFNVIYQGQSGWISAEYVETDGAC